MTTPINKKRVFNCAFANDNDNEVLKAPVWAMEALMQLHENSVMLPTVHRDFEDKIAKQGQVVVAHRPCKFESERKVDGDSLVVQDATATEVDVRMDFHSYTSFMIFDGEQSKAFKDLVALYLTPAVESMSQEIDEILCGQKYKFKTTVGQLGTKLTADTLVDISETFNLNLVPSKGRFFVMSPTMEADLQKEELFTAASQVGDDGTALRLGSLGVKYGIANVMSQNMSRVAETTAKRTGAINKAGGYSEGTNVLAVDGFSAIIVAGSWCKIAGDDRPRRITAAVGGATPTSVTLEQPIDFPVADNAVVTVYTPGAVNKASGYAANYTKRVDIDGLTVAPRKGQLVSFGATGQIGAAIGIKNTTTSLKLDSGLETSTADNTTIGVGPGGEYGMAYTRNAIAFVSRPLVLPPEGTVRSAVVEYKGLGLRVTMAYDPYKQGTLVTVDLLHGSKVIDENQGMLVVR